MNDEQEKSLTILMEWVSERIASKADVPRVSDVIQYAHATLGFRHLKPATIARRLRLHPAYVMTSHQTRGRLRSKRYRPIVSNTLGMLHGDIGYFPITRDYETPVSYRAGFLVLRDVLSRFLYTAIIIKNKSSESMIRAFEQVLEKHEQVFGSYGHKIKSISFDQETSIMSSKVQNFLREKNISFHAFRYTASKSKVAENAIKQIRNTMARVIQNNPEEIRWWRLLDQVTDILNYREIRIGNKNLGWRPRDVNKSTLREFLKRLQKVHPLHEFSQYELVPQGVQFKFPVGSVVRPKLIVTSSAVIGEKRSAISLEADPFIVAEHLSYVNARWEAGRAYRCFNKRTREEEIFDEDDLAASVE